MDSMLMRVVDEIRNYAYAGKDFELAEREIYYRNGNDGTRFDWDMNDRTCEFYIFFDESKCGSQYGYLKAFVRKDGQFEVFRYTDLGRKIDINETKYFMTEKEAREFMMDLDYAFDRNEKWDAAVRGDEF